MSSPVIYGYDYAPSKRGQTAVIISDRVPHNQPICKFYPEVETLHDAFMRGRRISPNSPCYGYRKIVDGVASDYIWMTYNEVFEAAKQFGSGLVHLNLTPKVAEFPLLGIYSKNCLQWGLAEQACNAFNICVVPVYDTLGADAVEFILQQTEMKTCVCGPNEVLKLLALYPKTSKLEVIIQIGEISEKTREVVKQCNLRIYSFDEILEAGKAHPAVFNPPCAEDVCTICYTSGTTGLPKGAMITNRNFIAALMGTIQQELRPEAWDRYLSYLPLAHVLERCVQLAFIVAGARVGYSQGDTRKIVDDLKALRPTVFCSVPRLLNRMYDAINASIKKQGRVVEALFHWGLRNKMYWLQHGEDKYSRFFDPVLFDRVRKSAGLDCVRVTISGSAPLSDEVKQFLRCVLNGAVVEGYGATETAGPTSIELSMDTSVGSVGGPIAASTFKLVDVPEMGYLATDREHNGQPCLGRGELCIKGYNIISGYYHSPELTKAAFDEEGFFRTGDIAIILPNYAVKIVDRKKNFFKLAQGEYVAAEKLEILYGASPFVSQIFVHGDSLQSYLVAIVVPEKGYVMRWAKTVPALKDLSFEAVCASKELHDTLAAEFARVMKESQLKGFERIQKFTVDSEGWSVENGLLTPTFKLLRKNMKTKYQDKITEMYAN